MPGSIPSPEAARRIGIIQGRMVASHDGRIQCFPRTNWEEDFRRVGQAGFQTLEWLYDHHDAAVNPLNDDEGLRAIANLSRQTGVVVASLCAHCFVEQPLTSDHSVRLADSLSLFSRIAARGARIGVQRVVMPLEDPDNVLERDSAGWARIVRVLQEMCETVAGLGMMIAIESGLAPGRMAELLRTLPREHLGVNYDTGNSAGVGYDPVEEWDAYGDRIISIHIKEKKYHGGTLPLGEGDARFQVVADLLKKQRFHGDLVLEVARCKAGEELDYARHNRGFVETLFVQGANSAPNRQHRS